MQKRRPMTGSKRRLAAVPGDILSDTIPLVYIGRNRVGLWVARESENRFGGLFIFKWSALRFATRSSGPTGCAKMFIDEGLELEGKNSGNPLAPILMVILRSVMSLIPKTSPF